MDEPELHEGHDMSAMSMAPGVPSRDSLQRMYWAVVGAAIGLATLVNVLNRLQARHRLSSARKGLPTPARPERLFVVAGATVTAIARELAYAVPAPLRFGKCVFAFPPLGRTTVVLAYATVIVVLGFYRLELADPWAWEDVGYQTGYVAMCQFPLIFLLAGKNNVIGLLTGSSYERLNWLHRWVARGLFLTSTIHMGYWFTSWDRWDYIKPKIQEDLITQRGLAAWGVLAWIVISSMTPIRGWCYEFFVLQHLLSFVAFFATVYLHTPDKLHVWIWIPAGLFGLDRLVRLASVLYTNLSLFHPKQRRAGKCGGLWACRAEFTPLPHHTTRITIRDPPVGWWPGQHVFLSCHAVVPLQSHPFTIASLPHDGRMEFLVRAERGGTRRMFRHAESQGLPVSADVTLGGKRAVAIEGPYGRMRPLPQFDSVVLLAGSTGATFTVPLMRDILCQWRLGAAVTRHVRFVWVVKGRGQLSWFAEQLTAAAEEVEALQASGLDLDLEMSVYVTCDESMTTQGKQFSIASSSSSDAEAAADGHGGVERLRTDEKYAAEVSEKRVASAPRSHRQERPWCGPDGGCCCTATVADEDAITTSTAAQCTCACEPRAADATRPATSTSSASTSTTSSSSPSKPRQQLHPAITLLFGRPQARTIIRKTLERAEGESAVVVCGPAGLVGDVRGSVVALSDERAVHKGTGAQGVWLHCEGFGY
ncbi:MAG: hypothetical protein M1832_002484 [Thelocarpon impressellum]|nr:MAG: hypothetical protein M1832_002484 [Thelocarpon impressellum]